MNGYTQVRMRSDELIGEAERVRLAAGDPAVTRHHEKPGGLRHAAARWWRRLAGHGASRRGGLAVVAGGKADGRTL
jgi:hypothetical protein